MNNLNCHLRVSKNKPPFVFRKDNDGTLKVNEENIENNFVFCIDPGKAFAIKQYQDLFFEISHIRTK